MVRKCKHGEYELLCLYTVHGKILQPIKNQLDSYNFLSHTEKLP